MLDTQEYSLTHLEFTPSFEDPCQSIRISTGASCDRPATHKVALTCASHHTRNILLCSEDLAVAQNDSFSCVPCDKVGGFELVVVLAATPIKK